MTTAEAIRERHSVRQYRDEPLRDADAARLQAEIDACNAQSRLHIQLVRKEPKAFSGALARYGTFRGVTDYLAILGPRGKDLEETCGYVGEQLVLKAQQMGLNTCWVALTYRRVPGAVSLREGEALCAVIAVGYGQNPGKPHRTKTLRQVTEGEGPFPPWFVAGVEAALLAPTALNRQGFRFSLSDGRVRLQMRPGPYAKLDKGIVRLHFALGAGEAFRWAEPLPAQIGKTEERTE